MEKKKSPFNSKTPTSLSKNSFLKPTYQGAWPKTNVKQKTQPKTQKRTPDKGQDNPPPKNNKERKRSLPTPRSCGERPAKVLELKRKEVRFVQARFPAWI